MEIYRTTVRSIFLHDLNNFDKSSGWRCGLLYFTELHKYIFGTLKHKLREAVYCAVFVNEITIKKEKISIY